MARVLNKLRALVRTRGVLGASRHLVRRVLDRVTAMKPANRRWARDLEERSRRFDESLGVDTGGMIPTDALGATGDNRRFAVAYLASLPEEFARTLDAAAIDHREFTFVDFGSGKGRAVLLALRHPFRKVIGVEFSPLLHEIAKRNLATYRGERRCTDVELVCADAAAFEPPDAPLACYFYNPFQREVMSAVAANLRASFERSPRPMYMLYNNPAHENVLAREPFLEKVAGGPMLAVYRARGFEPIAPVSPAA